MADAASCSKTGRPRSVSASTTTSASPQHHTTSGGPSFKTSPKTNSRTPAQFCLQSVFIRFVHAAELKVDALVYSSTSITDSDLSVPLRPGVDPEFDGLLSGLGSVAKHCPKLIIDCVMVWRKSKSEKSADDLPPNIAPVYRSKELEHVIKERKSLVSNFILCRALIEIIKRLSKDTLPNDLGHKLEEMVFAQLRNIDPELTLRSSNRQANVDLFSELIGTLSNIRFATVSDRFVSEISELTRAGSSKEMKLDLIIRSMRFLKLKIYPMEYLEETAEFLQICADFFQNSHSAKIKLAYAELFAELLEPVASVAQAEVNLPAWMGSIENIYMKAMRMSAKKVYQHVALPLITTVLCVSKKEFFLKNWPPVVEICLQKFRDRQLKTMAFNCVSRLVWVYLFRSCDPMSINSQRRIESLLRVLFPVKSRIIVPQDTPLDYFVRLIYIVLVRFTDPMLDLLASLLLGFETPTANIVNASPMMMSGTVQGFSFGSGAGATLTNAAFSSDTSPSDDSGSKANAAASPSIVIGDATVNPERLVIALRSFLLLLAENEEALRGGNAGGGSMYGALGGDPAFGPGLTGASVSTVGFIVVEGKVKIPQPTFPSSNLSMSGGIEPLTSILTRAAPVTEKNPFTPVETVEQPKPLLNDVLSDKVLQRMSSSVREYMERVNTVLGRVAIALDKVCGGHLWKNVIPANENMTVGPGSSLGGTQASAATVSPGGRRLSFSDSTLNDFRQGTPLVDSATSNLRDKTVLYDLMKNYIDCLPRFTPAGMNAHRIVELLSRYTLHKDDGVRIASISALMRISTIKQGENDDVGGRIFWNLGDKLRPGASMLQGVIRILGNTLSVAINERIASSTVVGESTEGVLRSGGLGLYVDMLELWLKEITDAKVKNFDEEEVERIFCEIEGRGLLYLCSTSISVRKMGLLILRLVLQFEKQLSSSSDDVDPENLNSKIKSVEGTPELRRRQALYRPSRPNINIKKPPIFKAAATSRLKVQRSRIIQIMEQAGHDLVSRHYLDPIATVGSMRFESQKYQSQHQQNLLRLLGIKDSLCVIAVSSNSQDTAIWYRCFPDLVQWLFEFANPKALRICLVDVFARLVALHPSIQIASDFPASTKLNTSSVKWVSTSATGGTSGSGMNSSSPNLSSSFSIPATDNIIDQWRIYVTFASATIEVAKITPPQAIDRGMLPQSPMRRLGNVEAEDLIGKDRAMTPAQLFTMLLPLLSCERNSIRQCVVASLGAVHSSSYKALLEGLQPLIRNVTEDMRLRPMRSSESSNVNNAGGKRSISTQAQVAMISNIKRLERLRVEITHLLSLVADFVDHEILRTNESLIKPIASYIRDISRFLSSPDVKAEWDYQMLRYYFCAFVDRFYDRLLNSTLDSGGENGKGPLSSRLSARNDLNTIFPYELRASLFHLFEQWCGYSMHSIVFLDRETKTMLSALDPIKDNREKGVIASTMDEQLKVLATAALKSMASLIKGPIAKETDGNDAPYIGPQFNAEDIFRWLNDMFKSPDDAVHSIALSTIESLLSFNPTREDLLEHAVSECYIRAPISPGAIYYFSAIVNVFAGRIEEQAGRDSVGGVPRDFPCLPQRMIMLAIYKSGDLNPQVRRGAVRLLKSVEQRLWGHNYLSGDEAADQTLDDSGGSSYEPLSIGSSLPVMYKYAQTMISARIASERPQFTCEAGGSNAENVFLKPPQRFTEALAKCDAILTNLFYLTMKYGDDFISEVENLWIQLVERRNLTPLEANGELSEEDEELRSEQHVDTIIDFLLAVGIRRRNPKFVAHAKKVVVYISRTSANEKLVAAIISRITPRSLIPNDASKVFEDVDDSVPNPVNPDFYIINLSQILPEMPMRPAFGSGVLACVFLVDLAIELGSAPLLDHLALILHVIFIQLDHFITLVCEQMRLLLINLIQIIVPKKIGGAKVESVLAKLDLKEGRRIWPYQDLSPEVRDIESAKQLAELVADILSLFKLVEPRLSEIWADVALSFAVGCPVRHSACRSLQIFRSISPVPTQRIVGELLHRLSSTIADTTEEVQGFSLEILITINSILKNLNRAEVTLIPQFFWSGVSCLTSPLEWEFGEGVLILKKVLSELDLTSQSVRNGLLVNQPTKWRGQFNGIQPLLLKGMCSSTTEKTTVEVINLLLNVDNDSLVDTGPSRVLFVFLSNFIRFLQGYQPNPLSDGGDIAEIDVDKCLAVADSLSKLAERCRLMSLARILSSYSKQRFRAKEDFGRQAVLVLRDSFFPEHEAQTLQFLISLLRNKLPFYKKRVLQIFKFLLPAISSRSRGAPVGNSNGPWGPGWGVGGGAASPQTSKLDWTSAAGSTLLNLEEDLISPMVDLLSTELADEALDVLDEILAGGISTTETSLKGILFGGITMKWITKSVRTTDPSKILSVGRDLGSKSENGKGKTELPSGWRVTEGARATKTTRYNMAGVASTCAFSSDRLGTKKAKGETSPDARIRIHMPSVPRQPSPLSKVQNVASDVDADSSFRSNGSNFALISEIELNSSNQILEALDDLENYFGVDEEVNEEAVSLQETLREQPSAEHLKASSIFRALSETDAFNLTRPMSLMNPSRPKRKDSISSDSSEVSYSAETFEPHISRETSLSSLMIEGVSMPVSDNEDFDDEEDQQAQMGDPGMFGASLKSFSPLLDVPKPPIDYNTPSNASTIKEELVLSGSARRKQTTRDVFPPSPRSNASASLRLLSQSFAFVQVVFAVIPSPESSLTEFGMSSAVEEQVRLALRISSEMNILLSTYAEPMEGDDKEGFKVTISIKILEHERVDAGKPLLMAALAEELAALIIGDGDDLVSGERNILLSGPFTIDRAFTPDIYIDFMKLLVPYVPEGFRHRLPHRKNRPIHNPTSRPTLSVQSSPFLQPNGIDPFTTSPSPSQQVRKTLSLEAAVDALRIFPTAFGLSVQLYEDWLALVSEVLEKSHEVLGDAISEQQVLSILQAMRGLRGDGQGYSPLLLRTNGEWAENESDGIDEVALVEVGKRLLWIQEDDPRGFNSFLDRREQMMAGINNQVSTYLSARQSASIDTNLSEDNEMPGAVVVRRCAELGVSLMTLYGMVLGLERLLEEFIGNQERLRCRYPGGVSAVGGTLEPSSTLLSLKQEIESVTKIPISRIKLKCGFPPKEISGNQKSLQELGIRDGEQIVVEEGEEVVEAVALEEVVGDGESVAVEDGFVVVREMEDDNSCMFHAIAYLFERDAKLASKIRKLVATSIESDPTTYNSILLGREPSSYTTWIQTPESWGGAIELSILSTHYSTEICSIDVSTLRVDRFGEDVGHEKMAIVLYSGIHYDAVAVSPAKDAPVEFDLTVHSRERGEEILKGALKVAGLWKQKHKFTDLASFTLKCGVCKTGIKGQKEAQEHALKTGHASFEEYS
ncbi:Cell morphogenesis protein PAG1 [Phlyctochytrium planicorne]|nr:Cell morphogenesis protein PAG1 [Phlyctochytrium planicorne]